MLNNILKQLYPNAIHTHIQHTCTKQSFGTDSPHKLFGYYYNFVVIKTFILSSYYDCPCNCKVKQSSFSSRLFFFACRYFDAIVSKINILTRFYYNFARFKLSLTITMHPTMLEQQQKFDSQNRMM